MKLFSVINSNKSLLINILFTKFGRGLLEEVRWVLQEAFICTCGGTILEQRLISPHNWNCLRVAATLRGNWKKPICKSFCFSPVYQALEMQNVTNNEDLVTWDKRCGVIIQCIEVTPAVLTFACYPRFVTRSPTKHLNSRPKTIRGYNCLLSTFCYLKSNKTFEQ